MVQCLGPCAFTARALGSVPGWGTKILQGTWCGKKKKKIQFDFGLDHNHMRPSHMVAFY